LKIEISHTVKRWVDRVQLDPLGRQIESERCEEHPLRVTADVRGGPDNYEVYRIEADGDLEPKHLLPQERADLCVRLEDEFETEVANRLFAAKRALERLYQDIESALRNGPSGLGDDAVWTLERISVEELAQLELKKGGMQ
jgi:hypothetical protein